MGSFERANDEFLHFNAKGFLSDIILSKVRIVVSELEGEGRENCLEVAPVVEIVRTEKARPELPIREAHLRKCLGDSEFPSSSETVIPEYTFILFTV